MTIENKALDLLLESNTHSIPVNLIEISDYLNLKVHNRELDDDTSGMLVINSNKRDIIINEKHHPNRQRFTIAHELGHLVLHHKGGAEELFIDKKTTFLRSESHDEGEKNEVQANKFAAALLMPKTLLLQFIERRNIDPNDEVGVSYLASAFKVSEQAMLIRLLNIGLAKLP